MSRNHTESNWVPQVTAADRNPIFGRPSPIQEYSVTGNRPTLLAIQTTSPASSARRHGRSTGVATATTGDSTMAPAGDSATAGDSAPAGGSATWSGGSS